MSALPSWIHHFYHGRRLESEISLFAAAIKDPTINLEANLYIIYASYGVSPQNYHQLTNKNPSLEPINKRSLSDISDDMLSKSTSSSSRLDLILAYSEIPDTLLSYVLLDILPKYSPMRSRDIFGRLCLLILREYPQRPDLIYQLIEHANAMWIIKSLPNFLSIAATEYYSKTVCSVFRMHSLWSKGLYQQLFFEYISYFRTTKLDKKK